jgi:hypothetical protein
MLPAIEPSKEKAPGWGLLVYCVVVLLLAWWPWNVWLVFGAAYASRLKSRNARALLAADTSQAPIRIP